MDKIVRVILYPDQEDKFKEIIEEDGYEIYQKISQEDKVIVFIQCDEVRVKNLMKLVAYMQVETRQMN